MYSALHSEPEWDVELEPHERGGLAVTPPARPVNSPKIRSRLHVICALYANTPTIARRLALLDHLETLTLEAAAILALDLLEQGWRPPAPDASLAAT